MVSRYRKSITYRLAKCMTLISRSASRVGPGLATALILQPVTIEQPEAYKMPVFSIPAPAGEGPFRLNERGRAMLSSANHLNARPLI